MKRDVRRFENLGFCLVAGKKMFDPVTAEKVSRDMRRRKDTNHHPYLCSGCRSWHVGSSDLRRQIKTSPQQPWQPLPLSHYQQKAA
jgi:hypothetical protein